MIIFEPVVLSPRHLTEYSSLLSQVFGAKSRFSVASLDWLYAQNPDGSVIGFNAYDDNFLAAHYVCIPSLISVNGVRQKSLLSLNTATHKNYQGKGLFTKLANLTYEYASSLGFESIYGVANDNSTPGFINKLGFELISPLNAYLGIGSLTLNFDNLKKVKLFKEWNPPSLLWRSGCPYNPVTFTKWNGALSASSATDYKYIRAYSPIPNLNLPIFSRNHKFCLNLYLGNIPECLGNTSLYFKIPNFLKPSPLNLIYKSLIFSDLRLDFDDIFFNYLDFDVF